jgi:hypothetical protein
VKVRPIHFVPDVAEAVRFYEALGLTSDAHSRSGHWIELAAAGGELCLHDAAIAADGAGHRCRPANDQRRPPGGADHPAVTSASSSE